MQNFEHTVRTESILEAGSILKSFFEMLQTFGQAEKLHYENISYNLGQIFGADVSDEFSWKPSMTVSEKSDLMFSHCTE